MADGYRCRPTDLAHTVCLTTAAVTGHIEWLVQKGWVVRVDSPSRNSYFAQLTPAGAAQLLLCGITTEQIETACAA
jgi:DNA-binding MarR family transcriptional regulator